MGMRMEQQEEALGVSPILNCRTVADLGHTCLVLVFGASLSFVVSNGTRWHRMPHGNALCKCGKMGQQPAGSMARHTEHRGMGQHRTGTEDSADVVFPRDAAPCCLARSLQCQEEVVGNVFPSPPAQLCPCSSPPNLTDGVQQNQLSTHHPCSHGFVEQRRGRSSAWQQPQCANAAHRATSWVHLAAQLMLDLFAVSSHGKKGRFVVVMAPPAWLFVVWVISASHWRVAQALTISLACPLALQILTPTGGTPSPPDMVPVADVEPPPKMLPASCELPSPSWHPWGNCLKPPPIWGTGQQQAQGLGQQLSEGQQLADSWNEAGEPWFGQGEVLGVIP
ncbi:hypothetical protein DV515_00013664 [Chloebia gouldiae]|uniref:Uncharacterized protein n=1 Tax=Chloebia gouldiae TaxID=44316 RepID=A0A3L8S0R3_CHLGU|nr:hypothetical protein DV515_00013664 [Chloebia gouldiae]